MEGKMIIQSNVFDILFAIFSFVIGSDFTISGMLIIKKGNASIEQPKFLGLKIIKFYHAHDKWQKQNKSGWSMFSPKNMGYYALISGIFWLFFSLLLVFSLFSQ